MDNDKPSHDASGSRWEPDAETQAQAHPGEEPVEQPVGQPARARADWRSSLRKNRAGLVGAAALLLVVSAGGGFAAGRATGDGPAGHRDLSSDHRGFDGGPGRVQLPPPGVPQGSDDLQGQEDG